MKVFRRARYFASLGFDNLYKMYENRKIQKRFDEKHRQQAKQGISWNWIEVQKHTKTALDFSVFWQIFKHRKKHFFEHIVHEACINNSYWIKQANSIVEGHIILFESQVATFDHNWHEDKLCNQQEKSFSKTDYFRDIPIECSKDHLEKDIRVVWELSRFNCIFPLIVAFVHTKDEKYSDVAIRLILDWIEKNPYLQGVNWMCPMEVAIRAINWIWALSFFDSIDEMNAQAITSSLYGHYHYLIHNWELYDLKTSNHYMADLVGALYLSYFFFDIQTVREKTRSIFHEFLGEIDKQIFPEGTSYEGSTNYHRVMTELIEHGLQIGRQIGFDISVRYHNLLSKMYLFLHWCTPQSGMLLQIGDNDSGKIVAGVRDYSPKVLGVKNFSQFGLSVYKDADIHISLRHHAYCYTQPVGHFHNDAASVTVSYQTQDIFVDPGSYVYTACVSWRNKFRSMYVHSTAGVVSAESAISSTDVFHLDMPETFNNGRVEEIDSIISLHTAHTLYKHIGLLFSRTIQYDKTKKIITIFDRWDPLNFYFHTKIYTGFTQFILHPSLDIHMKDDQWMLINQMGVIATVTSDYTFSPVSSWYSSEYGQKKHTNILRAMYPISLCNIMKTTVCF